MGSNASSSNSPPNLHSLQRHVELIEELRASIQPGGRSRPPLPPRRSSLTRSMTPNATSVAIPIQRINENKPDDPSDQHSGKHDYYKGLQLCWF
jgi:hypothetical protein